MKFVLISDTHMQHAAPEFPRSTAYRRMTLELPRGDILIHAGDFLAWGEALELYQFAYWLEGQAKRFGHVLIVAGNHDGALQRQSREAIGILERIPNVAYLQDSGVTIDGVRFWGSPWTIKFKRWFFMRDPGDDIDRAWKLIPPDTQVLITHSPPAGILDRGNIPGTMVGCERLAHRLGPEGSLRPRLHVFGHSHDDHGEELRNGIRHVNASLVDARNWLTKVPIELELEFD